VEREASNPARSRIGFHHTFRHSLAEGRRGMAQGYLRILDVLFSHGAWTFFTRLLRAPNVARLRSCRFIAWRARRIVDLCTTGIVNSSRNSAHSYHMAQ
jgi:hypothetical protein